MSQLIKKYSTTFFLILLLILIIPTFWRMFKPGIFSMQDFHFFRLYEYDKCIADFQIPCRWAPDVAFEYGQPLFNFYGQLPYLYGEIFRRVGISIIDTTKILFISSLVFSALAMFFLSKQLWKNNLAALLSAMIYTYAPYRAVDVFVRGALSECLAFVFFPLILLFFNSFVKKKKISTLLLFSISLSGLILTHNLSVLMFSFFIIPWGIYSLCKENAWKTVPLFLIAIIFTAGLTAFYILPVFAESHLVTIDQTIQGYFDYHNHFVTLKQLLITNFWGYGASTWGDGDGLSLSIGYIQWILPLLLILFLIWKKQWKKYPDFLILFFLGWEMLWLTHNKSVFIWEFIPQMAYIQFPWRFLGLSIFAFSLASGVLVILIEKQRWRYFLMVVIISLLILCCFRFFFEDLWYTINDQELFSGARYDQIISSSVHDYWPIYGKDTPIKRAPVNPIFIQGKGDGRLLTKNSKKAVYIVKVTSASAIISFPIVYFPGWLGISNNDQLPLYPDGDFGLITAHILMGESLIKLEFTNTLVRSIGDGISLGSVMLLILVPIIQFLKNRKIKNEN